MTDSVIRQYDGENASILLVVSVATRHETERRRFSNRRQLQTPFITENRKGWREETGKKLKTRNDTSQGDRQGAGYWVHCSGLLNAMQNTVFSYLKKTSLSFACVQGGRLALKCAWKLQTRVFLGWRKEKKVTFFLFLYFLLGFKPFHYHLRGRLLCGVNMVLQQNASKHPSGSGAVCPSVLPPCSVSALPAPHLGFGLCWDPAALPCAFLFALLDLEVFTYYGAVVSKWIPLLPYKGTNKLGSPCQEGASQRRDCSVFSCCDALVCFVCICDSKVAYGLLGTGPRWGVEEQGRSWMRVGCCAELEMMEKLITDHLFWVLCIPCHWRLNQC